MGVTSVSNRGATLVISSALLLAACSSGHATTGGQTTKPSACIPPAGGRCAGPEAVRAALIGKLSLSADQRELSGRFDCGGRLTATETADRVEVVYVASAVGRGQMACAAVPLQVSVAAPIGHRVIVDGVTGEPLALGR